MPDRCRRGQDEPWASVPFPTHVPSWLAPSTWQLPCPLPSPLLPPVCACGPGRGCSFRVRASSCLSSSLCVARPPPLSRGLPVTSETQCGSCSLQFALASWAPCCCLQESSAKDSVFVEPQRAGALAIPLCTPISPAVENWPLGPWPGVPRAPSPYEQTDT